MIQPEDLLRYGLIPEFVGRLPVIATLQSAMTITSEVATLRLVMASERAYDVQVLDDGSEVRLRRRT